jgi:hypothetical protein
VSRVLDGLVAHVREGREHTKNPEDAAVQSFFEARTELYAALHRAGLGDIADYIMVCEVYGARFCAWGVVDGATLIRDVSLVPRWKCVSEQSPDGFHSTSGEFGGTTFLIDNGLDGARVIALTTSMRDDNAARDGLARDRGEGK